MRKSYRLPLRNLAIELYRSGLSYRQVAALIGECRTPAPSHECVRKWVIAAERYGNHNAREAGKERSA